MQQPKYQERGTVCTTFLFDSRYKQRIREYSFVLPYSVGIRLALTTYISE